MDNQSEHTTHPHPPTPMPTAQTETIAALATAPGEGGIAVLRISGPKAPQILTTLFRPAFLRNGSKTSPEDYESHRLYYGKIFGPQNTLLDEGMAVWMKAPRSFTGEETVELHIHGGRLISQKILEVIYHLGVRPAEPGEFSQRAFLNGKIDLSQAEAVADMIAARSDQALKLAQAQWKGMLSKPISILRASLLDLLVLLEAAIDFPEEDIDILDRKSTLKKMDGALDQMQEWLDGYERGRILREGLIVALIGKPNVGKSSLLNALTREEAAIVHAEPGTTRDVIEKQIQLKGISLRLIDTAGIRDATGEVEREGIERSRRWLARADLVLALLDPSRALEPEDFAIFSHLENKKILLILNKQDLPSVWTLNDLTTRFPFLSQAPSCQISAKTGWGMKALEDKIPALFELEEFQKMESLILNHERHRVAIEKSVAALRTAREGLMAGISFELISADVLQAANAMGEIIGEVTTEHILEDIFGRFCIGK